MSMRISCMLNYTRYALN